jgi:hypothetical protein
MVEARTDVINYPYLMALDIWELDTAHKKARRARIVNCYGNWIGEDYLLARGQQQVEESLRGHRLEPRL